MRPISKNIWKSLFFVSVILVSSLQLYAQISTNGLVAYYPFNGNANDESGNGHHGVVSGPTLISDRFGNFNSAYSFDGSNDSVVVPHSPALNCTEGLTLAAWVKKNTSGLAKTILSKHSWEPQVWGYILKFDNDFSQKPDFSIFNNSRNQCLSSESISLNMWHLLVATYDVSTAKLYIDGALIDTQIFNTPLIYQNENLYIGCISFEGDFGRENFDGPIDDIRIYNRALNEREVDTLFHEGGWTETSINLSQGWNLASVPRVQTDYTASVVFPGSFGDLFWYDPSASGYTAAPTLELGKGYWTYFLNSTSITIVGPVSAAIPVQCKAGWNLVGGREVSVPISSLQLSGLGTIFGDAFGFDPATGAYVPVSEINPCKSVWIYITGEDCTVTIP